MKKILVLVIMFSFFFISCGKKEIAKQEEKKEEKKEDVKKEEKKEQPTKESLKDLMYYSDESDQRSENNASASLALKDQKGRVYMLYVFNKNDYRKDDYNTTTEKVGKYPALIEKEGTSVKLFAKISPNITAYVGWQTDFLQGYDNTDLMKEVLLMLDLTGLEKLKGDKIMGNELFKYFPKLQIKS